MKKIISLLVPLLLYQVSYSQYFSGHVATHHKHGEHNYEEELSGANVYWANTSEAVFTNSEGKFKIKKSEKSNLLVASFVGYEPDTIDVTTIQNTDDIHFHLHEENHLDNVVVEEKRDAQFYSSNSTIGTKNLTTSELEKLPCCNLSESFENDVSVDVSFADAVTGAKQIQMLGLAGTYTQILTENMPSIRGLATSYGLAYVPGPWLESIQISKGTSTVLNGYESITGQINTELKKAEKGDLFYLNLFANNKGRSEANLNGRVKISKNWQTILLAHGSVLPFSHDKNGDNFLDMPQTDQLNFMNRWKYENKAGVEGQIGVRVLQENRLGGQLQFIENKKDTTGGIYGININTKRYEAFAKLGFPIKTMHGTSIGSMYSATYHEQNSFFGRNIYNATEKSLYANLIFSTIIKTSNNKLNLGGSFLYDNYDEKLNSTNFLREEIVPGAFAQYNYSYLKNFSMTAGFRADFHNIYGVFLTPRLHFKYNLTNNTTLRASAGKGYRTANIFAENSAILASSRQIILEEELKVEEAWNYGANISQKINIWGDKKMELNVDFYRTDFVNQIVVDVEANSQEVRFYNLRGESYSNSFQAEISTEIIDRLDFMAAFRYNDVKIDMHDQLIEKPLVNKYKGLITLSYATKYDKWVLDVTNQFLGAVKLPSTASNPAEYQLPEKSKPYYILHAQISRNFKRLELYLGSENITNYVQKQPIIAADQPFGEYFDTSIIYAPIVGRTIYAGMRFKIKK